MRAYHAAHARLSIFKDTLAQRLLTPEEYQASEERHLRALQAFHPDLVSCPRNITWGRKMINREPPLNSLSLEGEGYKPFQNRFFLSP
jgi:hypothetical protein